MINWIGNVTTSKTNATGSRATNTTSPTPSIGLKQGVARAVLRGFATTTKPGSAALLEVPGPGPPVPSLPTRSVYRLYSLLQYTGPPGFFARDVSTKTITSRKAERLRLCGTATNPGGSGVEAGSMRRTLNSPRRSPLLLLSKGAVSTIRFIAVVST